MAAQCQYVAVAAAATKTITFVSCRLCYQKDLLLFNMFLSRLAERSGLFGILAPRRSKDTNKKDKNGDADEGKSNDNSQDEAVPVDTSGDDEPQEQESQEAILRKRRLDYQQKMENEAESRGAFCKKQRVKYHNRIQDTWYDAVIVGVHFDDGPDNPYYVSILPAFLCVVSVTNLPQRLCRLPSLSDHSVSKRRL